MGVTALKVKTQDWAGVMSSGSSPTALGLDSGAEGATGRVPKLLSLIAVNTAKDARSMVEMMIPIIVKLFFMQFLNYFQAPFTLTKA
jgi:hypothetical protein